MAGAGRRVFQPGEVLTASNTMNYLMDQAVMVFAGTAARGSAIGTAVSEGMVSYQKDSNTVEAYTGATWDALAYANLGRIVQTVQVTTSTDVSTTSSSFVSAGLAATITPRSNTNKILIIVSSPIRSTSSAVSIFTTIYRGTVTGTNLGNGVYGFGRGYGNPLHIGKDSITYLDSPATTSAVTYTYAIRADPAGVSVSTDDITGKRTITLLEVAA